MKTAKVKWDYVDASNPDVLDLKEGDLVTVIAYVPVLCKLAAMYTQDPLVMSCVISEHEGGWWEGQLRGQVGFFPGNYVEYISTPAPKLPPKPTKLIGLR